MFLIKSLRCKTASAGSAPPAAESDDMLCAAGVRAAVLEGLGWQCAPTVRDLLLRVSGQMPSL